jgi:hypothetical protein
MLGVELKAKRETVIGWDVSSGCAWAAIAPVYVRIGDEEHVDVFLGSHGFPLR